MALAEMAFAGDLGIEADLRGLPCDADCVSTASRLFSESNSRYVVEVEPDMYDSFARLMLNLPFGQLGTVVEDKRLVIRTGDGSPVISADLEGLREAWRKPLMWG